MNDSSRYSAPLVALTTLAAMAFGLAIAFLGLTPEAHPTLFWAGCIAVGGLFVMFLVLPTLRGARPGQRTSETASVERTPQR